MEGDEIGVHCDMCGGRKDLSSSHNLKIQLKKRSLTRKFGQTSALGWDMDSTVNDSLLIVECKHWQQQSNLFHPFFLCDIRLQIET